MLIEHQRDSGLDGRKAHLARFHLDEIKRVTIKCPVDSRRHPGRPQVRHVIRPGRKQRCRLRTPL